MIKAFQKQLQAMAADPKDPFTRYIRFQAGAREAVRFEAPLRSMILHMPKMILHIRQWAEDSAQPWKIRRAHNFVLAYLYNPEDFLPEKHEGLYGYLDDAYLVARVYEETLDEFQHAEGPFSEATVPAEDAQQWIRLTRELLPDVAARIDQVLAKLDSPRQKGLYFDAKGARQ